MVTFTCRECNSARPLPDLGDEGIPICADCGGNMGSSLRKVPFLELPTSDGFRPKYRYALLSVDGRDWTAATENIVDGIDAFEHVVRLGDASEIVEVV